MGAGAEVGAGIGSGGGRASTLTLVSKYSTAPEPLFAASSATAPSIPRASNADTAAAVRTSRALTLVALRGLDFLHSAAYASSADSHAAVKASGHVESSGDGMGMCVELLLLRPQLRQ